MERGASGSALKTCWKLWIQASLTKLSGEGKNVSLQRTSRVQLTTSSRADDHYTTCRNITFFRISRFVAPALYWPTSKVYMLRKLLFPLCSLKTASWSAFLSVTIYLSWTLLVFFPAQFLPIRVVDSHPYAKEAPGPVTSIPEGARLAGRLPQQSAHRF